MRRLCVAVAAGPAGLLARACRSGGYNRWHVAAGAVEGVEMAFAPPGADEPAVVAGLLAALRRLVPRAPAAPGPPVVPLASAGPLASGEPAVSGEFAPVGGLPLPRPVLTALHVGLTRVTDDAFGGEAVARTRALLRHPAVQAAARVPAPGGGPDGPGGGGALAVAFSDGLFHDLRAEGLPGRDWRRVPEAAAWLGLFGPYDAGPRDPGPYDAGLGDFGSYGPYDSYGPYGPGATGGQGR
ncbi:hypothetical protein RKE29_15710 [Streptomyces sp. B1866]|uniref:hypothetical protein n=1 Tax=Streptomyces sp. B1866 TaxID=3075431 RepID=UPI00288F500D|nr:hypothetical protein [Streptomyces sp. B1866]MDT3398070.1 hypothetical protein [Streptomyces sp. B1866]